MTICGAPAWRGRRKDGGQPVRQETEQGPQVDQDQFNKVMSYIDSRKAGEARSSWQEAIAWATRATSSSPRCLPTCRTT